MEKIKDFFRKKFSGSVVTQNFVLIIISIVIAILFILAVVLLLGEWSSGSNNALLDTIRGWFS
ncbi:MAG: hypothetical protein ABIH55_03010 [Nanoarchaeota archaeon]|nr:hypothetical protein [Nanoarchaeota archaeon]MBU1135213.1 hypothetical protein [Nanoarchaeota archaeon]